MTEDIEVRLKEIEARIEGTFAAYVSRDGFGQDDSAERDMQWLISELRSARKDAERLDATRAEIEGLLRYDHETAGGCDCCGTWSTMEANSTGEWVRRSDVIDAFPVPPSTQEEQ